MTKHEQGKSALSPEQLADAFRRWTAGTPASTLAEEFGLRRGDMRRRLRDLAGGRDAYRNLRDQGAGGQGLLTPGGGGGGVSDEGLPILEGRPSAQGWTTRIAYHPISRDQIFVVTSPEGFEYVRASSRERADIIMQGDPTLPPIRLKLVEGGKYHTITKEQREERKRAADAQQEERREKRARRKRRAAQDTPTTHPA